MLIVELIWVYYAGLFLGMIVFHGYLKKKTDSGLFGILPVEYLPSRLKIKSAIGILLALAWFLIPPLVLLFPELLQYMVFFTVLRHSGVQVIGAVLVVAGAIITLAAALQLGTAVRLMIPEKKDTTELVTTGL